MHHIFREVVLANDRVPIENPLVPVDGMYRMDLDALAAQVGPRTRALLLCNPHNPVGRAWSHTELEQLSRFCLERDILVVSDEVYYALLHRGTTYTPFANVSPAASMNAVTVTSASKSFNLTGLKHSLVIAENPDILEAYDRGQRKSNAYYGGSTMGIVATEAAMTHGDVWVQQLMTHVENTDHFSGTGSSSKPPKSPSSTRRRPTSPGLTAAAWACTTINSCRGWRRRPTSS